MQNSNDTRLLGTPWPEPYYNDSIEYVSCDYCGITRNVDAEQYRDGAVSVLCRDCDTKQVRTMLSGVARRVDAEWRGRRASRMWE